MRVGGRVRPGGLVLGCLGIQVCGEGPEAVPPCFPGCIGPRIQTTKAGGRPSFPDQSRPRRQTTKAGGRSFLLPWLRSGMTEKK
nr:MAG TPA: hypothetical protein [Caudoviricetes sp.]